MKIGELSDKMQDRLEQDRQVLENAVKTTLTSLQQNLSVSVQNVLATTEDAIHQRSMKLCQTLSADMTALEERSSLLHRSRWKVLALHALGSSAVVLGLAVGAWGTAQWWKQEQLNIQEEIRQLAAQKQELAVSLEILNKKTWGVYLHRGKDGSFVVFPLGTDLKNTWTVGQQPAIKLEK